MYRSKLTSHVRPTMSCHYVKFICGNTLSVLPSISYMAREIDHDCNCVLTTNQAAMRARNGPTPTLAPKMSLTCNISSVLRTSSPRSHSFSDRRFTPDNPLARQIMCTYLGPRGRSHDLHDLRADTPLISHDMRGGFLAASPITLDFPRLRGLDFFLEVSLPLEVLTPSSRRFLTRLTLVFSRYLATISLSS